MVKRLYKRYGIITVANNKKRAVMAKWQQLLMTMCQKVEATFGRLKDHHLLVSSLPRSVTGYFVHHVRVLLGYRVGNA
jgi:hypothetical protein